MGVMQEGSTSTYWAASEFDLGSDTRCLCGPGQVISLYWISLPSLSDGEVGLHQSL